MCSSPCPARCSRPQDVPNAHIEVGSDMGLHSLLRYSCAAGYKRRAGTSSLIRRPSSGPTNPWPDNPDDPDGATPGEHNPKGFHPGLGLFHRHLRQGYEVTPGDIPMVAPAAGNEEVPPPGIVPVG
ncbi:hypothetical protein WISP_27525 [Willisornis vidua]|uniref:Uncharacterized protein n=1 Tax=Willisornis vidua TaxID=1566151 RepID=A0ABQ9DL93_9PASS|nr:hypothetical protein WISP_27525 [Willisornis vidua]